MKQEYQQSCLKSSFCKFFGWYNGPCQQIQFNIESNADWRFSYQLLVLFYTLNCWWIFRYFPIMTRSTRRVWLVSRGCSFLHGTWSHLWCFVGPCLLCSYLMLFMDFNIEYCSLSPYPYFIILVSFTLYALLNRLNIRGTLNRSRKLPYMDIVAIAHRGSHSKQWSNLVNEPKSMMVYYMFIFTNKHMGQGNLGCDFKRLQESQQTIFLKCVMKNT